MISIIIPVKNREKHIVSALESVLRSRTRHRYEIVIVDNGSADNTFDIARQYTSQYPGIVNVVRCSKQGPGAARNAGIRHARFDLLAFIDSDCQLPKHYLDLAIRLFENPTVAAAGGPYRPIGNLNNPVAFSEMKFWEKIVMPKYDTNEGWLKKHEKYFISGYMQGGNMVIRRDALIKIGNFNEDFINSQDVVLSWDLIESGFKILWSPGLYVHHDLNAKAGAKSIFVQWYRRGRNHNLLVEKYSGTLEKTSINDIISYIFPIRARYFLGEIYFTLLVLLYFYGRYRGRN